MTVDVAQQVTSCGELSVGDEIEAWHNGKLFHRGEVIRTVAATDRPTPTATAHSSATATGRTSGRSASAAPAPVVPASHVPLFQAPSLAG